MPVFVGFELGGGGRVNGNGRHLLIQIGRGTAPGGEIQLDTPTPLDAFEEARVRNEDAFWK